MGQGEVIWRGEVGVPAQVGKAYRVESLVPHIAAVIVQEATTTHQQSGCPHFLPVFPLTLIPGPEMPQ